MKSQIQSKSQQQIEKNKDLLTDKKYYQFAQKIKLIAHRKSQSKKYQQAQSMFRLAANSLYSIQQVQKYIPFELMEQLVQIYSQQPDLLNQKLQNQFLSIISKKNISDNQIKLIYKLVQKTGSPSEHRTLSQYYIDYHIKNNRFADVQNIVASLGPKSSIQFVQKWTSNSQIQKSQVSALWCRIVLWTGIYYKIDDAQKMFHQCRQKYSLHDPYAIFTSLLLKTTAIKSKSAYETIQRAYEQFLKSDYIYSSIYQKYGVKYFGIEKKQGGLMSLIQ